MRYANLLNDFAFKYVFAKTAKRLTLSFKQIEWMLQKNRLKL